MNEQDKFIAREIERADRLREFIKGELRSMFIGARMQFTEDLFNYLLPEIESLLKNDRIKAPRT